MIQSKFYRFVERTKKRMSCLVASVYNEMHGKIVHVMPMLVRQAHRERALVRNNIATSNASSETWCQCWIFFSER